MPTISGRAAALSRLPEAPAPLSGAAGGGRRGRNRERGGGEAQNAESSTMRDWEASPQARISPAVCHSQHCIQPRSTLLFIFPILMEMHSLSYSG